MSAVKVIRNELSLFCILPHGIGYFDCPGFFHAGMCGERSCPQLCLCCESFFCLGPSMSSSRMYIMDIFDLRPDPWDNRLIRFSNCLMCISCVLDFIAIFVPPIRDCARTVHCIADCVFYSTIGCMAGQVNHEVDFRNGVVGFRPPTIERIDERTPIMGDGKVKNNPPPIIGEAKVKSNETLKTPLIGEAVVKG